jgi:hypothetical protein
MLAPASADERTQARHVAARCKRRDFQLSPALTLQGFAARAPMRRRLFLFLCEVPMSNENKRKPRRSAGLAARQARAASTMAVTLALVLTELQQLRLEMKARDAYYESVGMPVRPVTEG